MSPMTAFCVRHFPIFVGKTPGSASIGMSTAIHEVYVVSGTFLTVSSIFVSC